MDNKLVGSFTNKVEKVRVAMKALHNEGEFYNTIINENITLNGGEKALDDLLLIFSHLYSNKIALEEEFTKERSTAFIELIDSKLQLKKDIKFLIGLVDKEKAKEYPHNLKVILERNSK